MHAWMQVLGGRHQYSAIWFPYPFPTQDALTWGKLYDLGRVRFFKHRSILLQADVPSI